MVETHGPLAVAPDRAVLKASPLRNRARLHRRLRLYLQIHTRYRLHGVLLLVDKVRVLHRGVIGDEHEIRSVGRVPIHSSSSLVSVHLAVRDLVYSVMRPLLAINLTLIHILIVFLILPIFELSLVDSNLEPVQRASARLDLNYLV